MYDDIDFMRNALHDCKRHISQIPEDVITQYLPIDKFNTEKEKFFEPPDRDLKALFSTIYPFHANTLFVEDIFQDIREKIPEFIVSVIALGTDWLITLHKTEQYRKLEIINPTPRKDDLSDTSALIQSIRKHALQLLAKQHDDKDMTEKTRELFQLYQPDELHFDVRGCFQLIYNVLTLYVDGCDGIDTAEFRGFKVFPEEDREKVELLMDLVGRFCEPFNLLKCLPALEAQDPDFRKKIHITLGAKKKVLAEYYPKNIDDRIPQINSQSKKGQIHHVQYRLPVSEAAKSDFVSDSFQSHFIPNATQRDTFNYYQKEHGIVARSETMLSVFEDIETYAPYRIGVLILGGPGTGKKLIAEAFHERSGRKGKFITVDCSAIPKDIVESDLFGVVPDYAGFHKKEGQIGLFKQADKGTVFLDEIGDASYDIQGKIRRVIQDSVVRQLGGEDESIDIRVICATNIDLSEAIKKKSFRKDLYGRIAGKVIQLPQLSSRKDDIPLIAQYHFNQKCKKEKIKFSFKARHDHFSALQTDYNFTDIRELENFIYELVIKLNSKSDPSVNSLLESITPKAKRSSKKYNENYPHHLITYINNGFSNTITRNDFKIKDTRTLRKEMNTELLIIGEEFKYDENEIADHFINNYTLEVSDHKKLRKEINERFIEIIEYFKAPQEERSLKWAYAKDYEHMAIKLVKTRSDLI